MNNKTYWIIPAIIIAGLISFVFVSDYTPNVNNNINLPTASTKTFPSSYVDERGHTCHYAQTPEYERYAVCYGDVRINLNNTGIDCVNPNTAQTRVCP
jgi:hypothetical protein